MGCEDSDYLGQGSQSCFQDNRNARSFNIPSVGLSSLELGFTHRSSMAIPLSSAPTRGYARMSRLSVVLVFSSTLYSRTILWALSLSGSSALRNQLIVVRSVRQELWRIAKLAIENWLELVIAPIPKSTFRKNSLVDMRGWPKNLIIPLEGRPQVLYSSWQGSSSDPPLSPAIARLYSDRKDQWRRGCE